MTQAQKLNKNSPFPEHWSKKSQAVPRRAQNNIFSAAQRNVFSLWNALPYWHRMIIAMLSVFLLAVLIFPADKEQNSELEQASNAPVEVLALTPHDTSSTQTSRMVSVADREPVVDEVVIASEPEPTPQEFAIQEKLVAPVVQKPVVVAQKPVVVERQPAEPVVVAKTPAPVVPAEKNIAYQEVERVERFERAERSEPVERVPAPEWVEYQVQQGDTLSNLFRVLQLSLVELYAIVAIEGDDKPLSQIRPNQYLGVKVDLNGKLQALRVRGARQPILFVRNADGKFVRTQLKAAS
ncbi:MAG: LysM-like peptidoglycan-binding domain-containing protein [Vibrionaceae bacterium]